MCEGLFNEIYSNSTSTPWSNLVLEHGDDFIKNGIFFISLGFFRGINLSLGFKISNGLIKGVLWFLQDNLWFGLLSEGGLDLLKRKS